MCSKMTWYFFFRERDFLSLFEGSDMVGVSRERSDIVQKKMSDLRCDQTYCNVAAAPLDSGSAVARARPPVVRWRPLVVLLCCVVFCCFGGV